MTWTDIIRKLTSKRLWITIAGISAAVALFNGGTIDEVEGVMSIAGMVIGYVFTEASVDKARIKNINNEEA